MDNVKKRSWACIGYPESLPDDWLQRVTESGLPVAISPLHDLDVNEETGELKKAHYHVLMSYENPTTYANVLRFCESFGCTAPIPVESVKGYYKYLTHEGTPEKYQYDKNLIVCLNGFDILDHSDYTKTERVRALEWIENAILENSITEYATLLQYVISNGDAIHRYVMRQNAYHLNLVCTSIRFKPKE